MDKTFPPTPYAGIPSSVGIGIGVGVVVFPLFDLDAIPDRTPDNIEQEIALLEAALALGQEDFRLLGERLHPNLPLEERALFDVYQRMLDANDLGAEIIHVIRRGNWAQGAVRQVIQAHVLHLESLHDEYMRERAVDIRDLGRRILIYLQRHDRCLPDYTQATILVGEQLTAADLAEVPPGQLAGIISKQGSSNSHLAILARALGVPAVLSVSDLPVYDLQDKTIIIDGYQGHVYVEPNAALQHISKKVRQDEKIWLG